MTTTHDTALDGTIKALSGSLTAISTDVVGETIGTWRRSLSHSADAKLTTISDTLGELKDALGESKLDGKTIGGIMSRLGTQTAAAAKGADGDVAPKLEKLASLLTKAGSALT